MRIILQSALFLAILASSLFNNQIDPSRGQGSNAQTQADPGDAPIYLPLLYQTGIQPLSGPTVLVGAGDIAVCGSSGSEITAALLDQIPGTVFTAGDNSNQSGSSAQFQECFDPTWGRHKSRIRPSPGNHDYETEGAAGYYEYYGAAAGEAGKGYYSYDLGDWHIVALNGNCLKVGGCEAGSPQEAWLRADLAAHPSECTLAYWHQPLFSSGVHGGSASVAPLWQALYQAGAELILNGHDHHYERFAPQTPTGEIDIEQGIRQFIVGTGGAGQRVISQVAENSQVRNTGTYGVLKLILDAGQYSWEFVPVAGETFSDSGNAACH